jgi:hypothetical protein
MLKFISWHTFITTLSALTAIYYSLIIPLYYKKEIRAFLPLVLIGLLTGLTAHAQTADGNTGINQANTMIRGYFDTAVQLMYAIGAIVGLIGALDVYNKHQSQSPHTKQAAAVWFSGCIFLVVVATVIKSFFGL